MALEIIDLYVTCDIGMDGGNALVLESDAGKDYAVVLYGGTDLHPVVATSGQAGVTETTVYGKLISVTPKKNQCRVAIRGANMVFAYDGTLGVEQGITTAGVSPRGHVTSVPRSDDTVGTVLGWNQENAKVRVDMR